MDTTLANLIDLWDAARERQSLPRQDEIAAALAARGMAFAQTDESANRMRLTLPGMALDYGAVAKGYGVEEAWRVLMGSELPIYGIVDAGGNIKTVGDKPDGSDWQIGLTDPANPQELLGVLALAGGQVAATSGDYQRYQEIDGRRYHHLLSPITGWPAEYNHSATAICADGLTADYYSTLLFLLPTAEAVALAEATPGLEAVLIGATGEAFVTAGLAERVKWR
ncbi:MAG: FAD:protein FMN transferase [Peptococcaceae bacterium]|nr:FAD:protein FMN transferase [Peptococcaceae bacterium]